MKVTLDLDALLKAGKITPEEHQRFSRFASDNTGSAAINYLIGFGVLTVSSATLALIPTALTSIILGLVILLSGLLLLRSQWAQQWQILAQISLMLGALMSGGGILVQAEWNLAALGLVTLIYTATAILAQSPQLSVLATLTLAGCLYARHGSLDYELIFQNPLLSIASFSLLSVLLLQAVKRLKSPLSELSRAALLTSILLTNLHFWLASLSGPLAGLETGKVLSSQSYALIWAILMALAGLWAWRNQQRAIVNAVAGLGTLHFYSQWFTVMDAEPWSLLLAGLLALGFAIGIKVLNNRIEKKQTNAVLSP